jgi:ATP-dependent Clp protease adapter protein ClpS
MTPQEPKGEQASADAGVQVAIRMLEHSLVAHGATTDKGKALNRVIGILAKAFGKTEDEAQQIMPAELKSALMAPGGEPGPVGAAA